MRPLIASITSFLVLLPLPVLGAGLIIINEVAWMGSLPKSGETATQAANNEWIELKNNTASSINLDGWKLTAQDGTPDIVLTGSIAASGFFLLERTGDDTVFGIQADQIYVGALSNSGEHLLLKNASGEVIDEVNASSGWPAGDNNTKQTMQFVGSSWITASSTPRAENSTVAASSSSSTASPTPTPQGQTIGQISSPVISVSLPNIKVYAGEDKVVAAGSLTEFMGEALGLKNEPLENPRFWWNFGDGANQEGRMASHIFQVPGKYMVGMHVSSGSNAASDYLKIEVIANQIKIKGVLIGEEGFLTLLNPADADIDIGEWILEDSAGRKFFIPAKTKIGAKSEISLANRLTGILRDGLGQITLHYPNSLRALEWKEEVLKISPVIQAVPVSQNQVVKAEVQKKETSDLKVSSAATSPVLAQISSPSLNIGSKTFLFSAFLVSFAAAFSYLFIKFR